MRVTLWELEWKLWSTTPSCWATSSPAWRHPSGGTKENTQTFWGVWRAQLLCQRTAGQCQLAEGFPFWCLPAGNQGDLSNLVQLQSWSCFDWHQGISRSPFQDKLFCGSHNCFGLGISIFPEMAKPKGRLWSANTSWHSAMLPHEQRLGSKLHQVQVQVSV